MAPLLFGLEINNNFVNRNSCFEFNFEPHVTQLEKEDLRIEKTYISSVLFKYSSLLYALIVSWFLTILAEFVFRTHHLKVLSTSSSSFALFILLESVTCALFFNLARDRFIFKVLTETAACGILKKENVYLMSDVQGCTVIQPGDVVSPVGSSPSSSLSSSSLSSSSSSSSSSLLPHLSTGRARGLKKNSFSAGSVPTTTTTTTTTFNDVPGGIENQLVGEDDAVGWYFTLPARPPVVVASSALTSAFPTPLYKECAAKMAFRSRRSPSPYGFDIRLRHSGRDFLLNGDESRNLEHKSCTALLDQNFIYGASSDSKTESEKRKRYGVQQAAGFVNSALPMAALNQATASQSPITIAEWTSSLAAAAAAAARTRRKNGTTASVAEKESKSSNTAAAAVTAYAFASADDTLNLALGSSQEPRNVALNTKTGLRTNNKPLRSILKKAKQQHQPPQSLPAPASSCKKMLLVNLPDRTQEDHSTAATTPPTGSHECDDFEIMPLNANSNIRSSLEIRRRNLEHRLSKKDVQLESLKRNSCLNLGSDADDDGDDEKTGASASMCELQPDKNAPRTTAENGLARRTVGDAAPRLASSEIASRSEGSENFVQPKPAAAPVVCMARASSPSSGTRVRFDRKVCVLYYSQDTEDEHEIRGQKACPRPRDGHRSTTGSTDGASVAAGKVERRNGDTGRAVFLQTPPPARRAPEASSVGALKNPRSNDAAPETHAVLFRAPRCSDIAASVDVDVVVKSSAASEKGDAKKDKGQAAIENDFCGFSGDIKMRNGTRAHSVTVGVRQDKNSAPSAAGALLTTSVFSLQPPEIATQTAGQSAAEDASCEDAGTDLFNKIARTSNDDDDVILQCLNQQHHLQIQEEVLENQVAATNRQRQRQDQEQASPQAQQEWAEGGGLAAEDSSVILQRFENIASNGAVDLRPSPTTINVPSVLPQDLGVRANNDVVKSSVQRPSSLLASMNAAVLKHEELKEASDAEDGSDHEGLFPAAPRVSATSPARSRRRSSTNRPRNASSGSSSCASGGQSRSSRQPRFELDSSKVDEFSMAISGMTRICVSPTIKEESTDNGNELHRLTSPTLESASAAAELDPSASTDLKDTLILSSDATPIISETSFITSSYDESAAILQETESTKSNPAADFASSCYNSTQLQIEAADSGNMEMSKKIQNACIPADSTRVSLCFEEHFSYTRGAEIGKAASSRGKSRLKNEDADNFDKIPQECPKTAAIFATLSANLVQALNMLFTVDNKVTWNQHEHTPETRVLASDSSRNRVFPKSIQTKAADVLAKIIDIAQILKKETVIAPQSRPGGIALPSSNLENDDGDRILREIGNALQNCAHNLQKECFGSNPRRPPPPPPPPLLHSTNVKERFSKPVVDLSSSENKNENNLIQRHSVQAPAPSSRRCHFKIDNRRCSSNFTEAYNSMLEEMENDSNCGFSTEHADHGAIEVPEITDHPSCTNDLTLSSSFTSLPGSEISPIMFGDLNSSNSSAFSSTSDDQTLCGSFGGNGFEKFTAADDTMRQLFPLFDSDRSVSESKELSKELQSAKSLSLEPVVPSGTRCCDIAADGETGFSYTGFLKNTLGWMFSALNKTKMRFCENQQNGKPPSVSQAAKSVCIPATLRNHQQLDSSLFDLTLRSETKIDFNSNDTAHKSENHLKQQHQEKLEFRNKLERVLDDMSLIKHDGKQHCNCKGSRSATGEAACNLLHHSDKVFFEIGFGQRVEKREGGVMSLVTNLAAAGFGRIRGFFSRVFLGTSSLAARK